MNNNFSLGDVLKKIRIEKGMSQETVAFEAEITTAYYGLVERGKKNPTVKIDISMDYFETTYKYEPYRNITYAENLVLQTNARTKDSVEFTFIYSSEGLGELEADLNCTAEGLGMEKLTIETQEQANLAIDKPDNALNKVNMIRSTFGAAQNRLEHKIANLNNMAENLTSAESRIRDTNMAKEMTELTKNQILNQSAQAMLAQANTLPQSIMSLIGAD